MVLLWAVPVVAAAAAVGLVLGRVRVLEELSRDLLGAMRRTGELREPLARIRTEIDRSGPLVDRVWAHWTEDRES
jgi:hypothetical protein